MNSSLIMALVMALHGGGNDETATGVMEKLRHRLDGINQLSCEYSRETIPSDYYVDLRAGHANQSREAMEKRLRQSLSGEFVETRDGLFRSNVTVKDVKGSKITRIVYSWDGKEDWTLTFHPSGEGEEEMPPNVVTKKPVLAAYEALNVPRQLLGVTILPLSKKPSAQSILFSEQVAHSDRAELLASESVGGSLCAVVAWYSHGNDVKRRETLWIDEEHGYVPRRYRDEMSREGGQGWTTMAEWLAGEIAAVQHPGGSTDGFFWYPKTLRQKIYDRSGHTYFETTVSIQRLAFNKRLEKGYFTPHLEDGSNVTDMQTKRTIVYGKGPSPRLRGILARRVEASKQILRASGTQSVPGPVSPPSRFESYGPWFAIALGVGGLVVVTSVAVRRHTVFGSTNDKTNGATS